jgi:hypothetical protein
MKIGKLERTSFKSVLFEANVNTASNSTLCRRVLEARG